MMSVEQERAAQGVVDMLTTAPQLAEYVDYVRRHWRELIERYQSAILWNDISYPAALDLKALFADYYNAVPDGVINDRSMQLDVGWLGRNRVGRAVLRFVVNLALKLFRSGGLSSGTHADFKTPEYTPLSDTVDYKWEATHGLGYSFGYNQNETAEHTLSVEDLVRLFVDQGCSILKPISLNQDFESLPAGIYQAKSTRNYIKPTLLEHF